MAPTAANDFLVSPEFVKYAQDSLINEARKLAPEHIAPLIKISYEKQRSGAYSIRMTVNRTDAPDARAQEFGSGIRSQSNRQSPNQLGPRGKILIKPKKGTFLAFPWQTADKDTLKFSRIATFKKNKEEGILFTENVPSFAGFAPDGNLLFNWVEHPGIHAANKGQGYLGYALERQREKISSSLGQEVSKQLLNKISRRFPKR